MGEDGRSHGVDEVLPPFGKATKEPEDSLQVGDRSFDARAESLGETELGIGFAHGFLFVSLSLLGDGDQLDLLAYGLDGVHVFVVTLGPRRPYPDSDRTTSCDLPAPVGPVDVPRACARIRRSR